MVDPNTIQIVLSFSLISILTSVLGKRGVELKVITPIAYDKKDTLGCPSK